MLDPLPVLGNSALLVLFVVSLWQWRRRPSPQRADILLLFGALSLHVVAVTIKQATGNGLADTLSNIGLLAQPYAAVRLVRHFRALPAWIHGAAFLGFGLSAATVAAASVADLPAWLFAPVLLYTLAGNLYALVSLVRGRRAASGVARHRLGLAVLGFGAFTTGLAVEGLSILTGAFEVWAAFAIDVVFLAMVVVLPPAFTPPRGLRRLWQSLEVRWFLERLRAAPLAPAAVQAALVEAAQRVSGGRAVWRSAVDADAQGAACPVAGAASVLRFPVGPSGSLDVCMERPALFPEEDEELIGLLAGVAGAELGRAEAAEAQAEALAEARRLERMKSEFVRTMAHELGNPLSPIQLQLPGLASDDEARRATALAVVSRNVARLRHLVADLRDVSHLHDGRVRLEVERLDLDALVAEACASHEAAAAAAGCRLEVAGRGGPGPRWVVGDRWRLAQCLDNLVGNAIKYSPAGGTITVRVRGADVEAAIASEGEAIVEVADEGLGLTAEQRGRLFRPYERLHREVAPQLPGTGLGLVIVDRLVRLHGGSIEVASEGPGQGSTFTMRLPVAGPDSPA
ncbi:MAG: sensor histidine kinase [Thermoplasmatota archaeon]